VGVIETVSTKSATIATAMMRSPQLHRLQSAAISRIPADALNGFRRRKFLGVSEMSVRRKTLAVMIYPKKHLSPARC
jgi:hypothetical protein